MKSKFKNAYMQTAKIFADLSYSRIAQEGAIVVKDDRIVSIGFNGMPAGWDNDCENIVGYKTANEPVYKTKPEVLNATMNALMKLAKSSDSGTNAAIFVTHAPCLDSAKGIYQAGITEVYYETELENTSGIDFLKKCKITIERIDNTTTIPYNIAI